MPIYEYTCRKCGKNFEHLQRSRTAPAPACPECGAPKPVKQLSVFSAQTQPARDSACSFAPSCRSGKCGGGSCPMSAGE